MKIIKGILILLVHLAAGIALSELIAGFLPGSVIGMVLLFLSLRTGLVRPESIREVAVFLTGNMTVFFLPAMIGIMELWGLLKVDLVGWLIVIVISTILVMVTSGTVNEFSERLFRSKEDRK